MDMYILIKNLCFMEMYKNNSTTVCQERIVFYNLKNNKVLKQWQFQGDPAHASPQWANGS